jgi:HEAT repeat protein
VKSRPVAGHKAWLSAAIHGWLSAAVRACKSPRHQIRIAAACAAIFIDEPKSTDVIRRLLQDRDLGVVKYALRAARQRRPSALKPLIGLIAQNASEPHLQALALEVDASL